MSEQPSVILSGFADEAANQKTAEQQFSAFCRRGTSVLHTAVHRRRQRHQERHGVEQVGDRPDRHLQGEYGINVSSIGSPIGKVKLLDVDDGTKNRFVPFKQYLAKDVAKACELAHAFETKLIRGFSFYHPKGTEAGEHLAASRRSARARSPKRATAAT